MENEEMDDTGLCWHCWHNDECNGRPAEIQAKGICDGICWVPQYSQFFHANVCSSNHNAGGMGSTFFTGDSANNP